jgi:hypothetical protein
MAEIDTRIILDTPMDPNDSGATITAEGLRERLTALCRGTLHMSDEGIAGHVENLLSELAGDPGDLLARMAAELDRHHIDGGLSIGLLDADRCTCGEIVRNWQEHLAAAAMSVRWEHEAQLAAKLDHAEGELSSRIEQHQRAVTRAIAAEGVIEPVRQHLAKIAHLAEFSPETKVSELLPLVKRLLAALGAPETTEGGDWLKNLADMSLAAAREKFGPTFAPETPEEA